MMGVVIADEAKAVSDASVAADAADGIPPADLKVRLQQEQ
jgi:hypothetical protein